MTWKAPRTRMFVVAAALAVAGCGAAPALTGSDSSATPTDYRTYPPPTTTLPPTTTTPPEPGTVLDVEATYVVALGDYPFTVADRFGVDFDEFVALNGWTVENGAVPEWPEPGTTIRIPAGATIPDGPAVLVPVPTVAPDPSATVAPGSSTSAPDDGCGTYTVKSGDVPLNVARALGTTVDELDAANASTDGYRAFYVGLVIQVPC